MQKSQCQIPGVQSDVEMPEIDDEDMEIPEVKDGNEDAPSMDDEYGKRSGKYNLQPRKPRDYSHLFATNNKEDKEDILEMLQRNMKQVLIFLVMLVLKQ